MELNAIKGKRGNLCIYFSSAVGLNGRQIGNVDLMLWCSISKFLKETPKTSGPTHSFTHTFIHSLIHLEHIYQLLPWALTVLLSGIQIHWNRDLQELTVWSWKTCVVCVGDTWNTAFPEEQRVIVQGGRWHVMEMVPWHLQSLLVLPSVLPFSAQQVSSLGMSQKGVGTSLPPEGLSGALESVCLCSDLSSGTYHGWLWPWWVI